MDATSSQSNVFIRWQHTHASLTTRETSHVSKGCKPSLRQYLRMSVVSRRKPVSLTAEETEINAGQCAQDFTVTCLLMLWTQATREGVSATITSQLPRRDAWRHSWRHHRHGGGQWRRRDRSGVVSRWTLGGAVRGDPSHRHGQSAAAAKIRYYPCPFLGWGILIPIFTPKPPLGHARATLEIWTRLLHPSLSYEQRTNRHRLTKLLIWVVT